MGTFLVDDNFPDHVKFAGLLDEHVGLWSKSLAWINRQETDGFIPTTMLRRLSSSKKPEKLVESLVRVGLWVACDGGWMVHDYLQWNASKEQRETKRQAARARMSDARAQKPQRTAPAVRARSPDVRANTSGTSPEVPEQCAGSSSTSGIRDQGSGSGSGSDADASDAGARPPATATVEWEPNRDVEGQLFELLRTHRAVADSGLDAADLARTLTFAGDARKPAHVLAAIRRGLDEAAPRRLADKPLVRLLRSYAERASERDIPPAPEPPHRSGSALPFAPPPNEVELAEQADAAANFGPGVAAIAATLGRGPATAPVPRPGGPQEAASG